MPGHADQRYYTAIAGRFYTPDPSTGVDLKNPTSWNKYAYAGGDPVNFNDRRGLMMDLVDDGGGGGFDYWGFGADIGGLDNPGDFTGIGDKPGDGGSSSQRAYTGSTNPQLNDPANATSPLIVQAKTLLGLQAALNALNNNANCAGLFENVSFTPNPATVLADIWNGTAYGSFAYGYLPDDVNAAGAITSWTNARTSGNGYLGVGPGGLPQFTSATITMNTNASTPNNISGTTQDWAVTILHELGHAYQMLFGSSSTQIRYDGDGSPAGTSAANASLVMRNCFFP